MFHSAPLVPLAVLLLGCLPRAVRCGWSEVSLPCSTGCETLGNCNKELGTCECPFGRMGHKCEVDVLPACRPSSRHGALPYIGRDFPKSCQCWRQLFQAGRADADKLFLIPSVWGAGHQNEGVCYEREGVPDDQQYSDPPSVTDANVTWRGPLIGTPDSFPLLPHPPDEVVMRSRNVSALPLNSCPDRCHEQGGCVKDRRDGAQPPKCLCMRGFKGVSCGDVQLDTDKQEQTSGCLNRCGGNGECLGGFCKCSSGFWGMDCTRSRAYTRSGTAPQQADNETYSRTALRIYRYELPWHVAFYNEPAEFWTSYDQIYAAWEKFFMQFSHDWVTRTENPYEANLFYVPLLAYPRVGNVGDPAPYVMHAVQYLQQAYPQLWGRNNGKDHFLFLTADRGACAVKHDEMQQNIIKVVHFAMQSKWPWTEHAIHPNGSNASSARKLAMSKAQYSCFYSEKDVATPDHWFDGSKLLPIAEATYKEVLRGEPRPDLLYFGGSIRPNDPHYSGGVRQEFHTHVATQNHTDLKFGGHHGFRKATFCLCPYGHGWGSRLTHSMISACIPVIIQDHVHMLLDDVLHYPDFSVRLRKSDVPQLMHILRAIPQDQIQKYRENMYKVYRAFTWSLPHGQAYNYTLKSLQRKLYNLWGHHY